MRPVAPVDRSPCPRAVRSACLGGLCVARPRATQACSKPLGSITRRSLSLRCVLFSGFKQISPNFIKIVRIHMKTYGTALGGPWGESHRYVIMIMHLSSRSFVLDHAH